MLVKEVTLKISYIGCRLYIIISFRFLSQYNLRSQYLSFDLAFLKSFKKTSLPVILFSMSGRHIFNDEKLSKFSKFLNCQAVWLIFAEYLAQIF